MRQATDATEDEAAAVVAKVRERKPQSLHGLLQHMANAGDLDDMVIEARAAITKTRVAAQLKLIRAGPNCEHGTAGGIQPHPTSGQPVCPQCRTKAKAGQLNASARSA